MGFTEVCKGSAWFAPDPWGFLVLGLVLFCSPHSGAISCSNDRWWQAVLPAHLPSEGASSLSHFKGINSITWNLMTWLRSNFYSWRAAVKLISLKFVLTVVGSRFSPCCRWTEFILCCRKDAFHTLLEIYYGKLIRNPQKQTATTAQRKEKKTPGDWTATKARI